MAEVAEVVEVCKNHKDWTFEDGNRKCRTCGIQPFSINISKHPQSILVYKRNIKNPVPTVWVKKNDNDPLEYDMIDYFNLKVTLVRGSDNVEMEEKWLSGKVEKRIDHSEIIRGKDIEFKGLKINRTSNQEGGTNFFLQFTLAAVMKNASKKVFVMNITKSKPIDVKSHTQQLKHVDHAPKAIIEEVIPSVIREENKKIAVIGRQFLDSKFVQVRIGETVIPKIDYKNDKLIICEIPPIDGDGSNQAFDLFVSNDNGKKWSTGVSVNVSTTIPKEVPKEVPKKALKRKAKQQSVAVEETPTTKKGKAAPEDKSFEILMEEFGISSELLTSGDVLNTSGDGYNFF